MSDLFNGYVESQSTLRIMAGKELQLAPAPDGQSMQIRLPVAPEPTPALAPDQIPLGDATGKAMAEPAAPDQSAHKPWAAETMLNFYNDLYAIQQGVTPIGLASSLAELGGAQVGQPTVGDERMQNIVGEFGATNNAFQLLRQLNPNAYIKYDEATNQPIAMIAHENMMTKNHAPAVTGVLGQIFNSLMSAGWAAISQNASVNPSAAAAQTAKAAAKVGKAAKIKPVPKNLAPIGHGDHGPIFDQFQGDWKAAALHLSEIKDGDAIGALYHPKLGPIDLVWGKEGSNASDGHGLSKIIAWHPEVVNKLQDFINEMHIDHKKSGENRMRLESADGKAAVRLDWDGKRKVWLLSAYEKGPTRSEKSTASLKDLLDGEYNLPPKVGKK